MKLNFDYKGTKVTYYLSYKKTKAIAINIDKAGRVNVIAPLGTPVYAVMDKVKGNAPWILAQLNKTMTATTTAQPKVGLFEQYMYLGKNYKLEIVVNQEVAGIKVKMVRGKFVVETPVNDVEAIRMAIVEWYKEKVLTKVKEGLKAYKNQFKIIPSKIDVADDHKFLFRANTESIFANVRLGILPADVIEYILVRTLAHINCPDEEKEVIKKLLPNGEKSVQWLEENKSNLKL